MTNDAKDVKPAAMPGPKSCPECGAKVITEEGCLKCSSCDWGLCI